MNLPDLNLKNTHPLALIDELAKGKPME